jgi:hypothetical protein
MMAKDIYHGRHSGQFTSSLIRIASLRLGSKMTNVITWIAFQITSNNGLFGTKVAI